MQQGSLIFKLENLSKSVRYKFIYPLFDAVFEGYGNGDLIINGTLTINKVVFQINMHNGKYCALEDLNGKIAGRISSAGEIQLGSALSNMNQVGAIDGPGTVITPNGCVYNGFFNKGVFNQDNVNGTQFFENKPASANDKEDFFNTIIRVGYTGKFLNGQLNGFGVMLYSDGSRYTGLFKNGKAHGLGRFAVHGDGVVYEGYFINNALKYGRFINKSFGVYMGTLTLKLGVKNDPHFNCNTFARGKMKLSDGSFCTVSDNHILRKRKKIGYINYGDVTVVNDEKQSMSYFMSDFIYYSSVKSCDKKYNDIHKGELHFQGVKCCEGNWFATDMVNGKCTFYDKNGRCFQIKLVLDLDKKNNVLLGCFVYVDEKYVGYRDLRADDLCWCFNINNDVFKEIGLENINKIISLYTREKYLPIFFKNEALDYKHEMYNKGIVISPSPITKYFAITNDNKIMIYNYQQSWRLYSGVYILPDLETFIQLKDNFVSLQQYKASIGEINQFMRHKNVCEYNHQFILMLGNMVKKAKEDWQKITGVDTIADKIIKNLEDLVVDTKQQLQACLQTQDVVNIAQQKIVNNAKIKIDIILNESHNPPKNINEQQVKFYGEINKDSGELVLASDLQEPNFAEKPVSNYKVVKFGLGKDGGDKK